MHQPIQVEKAPPFFRIIPFNSHQKRGIGSIYHIALQGSVVVRKVVKALSCLHIYEAAHLLPEQWHELRVALLYSHCKFFIIAYSIFYKISYINKQVIEVNTEYSKGIQIVPIRPTGSNRVIQLSGVVISKRA